MTEWATYYDEIPEAIANNDDLQSHILELVPEEPLVAKSLEGGSRKPDFREILIDFFRGNIDQNAAVRRVSQELPPSESPYYGNSDVFNKQWDERLIRSQVSRFYNQSVMEVLEDRGESECFVPHSPREYSTSDCTLRLAGSNQPIAELLRSLYSQQRQGNWGDGITIPDHANCTHTVVPTDATED